MFGGLCRETSQSTFAVPRTCAFECSFSTRQEPRDLAHCAAHGWLCRAWYAVCYCKVETMRLLYIARYRNALMERKIALLAACPDMEITLVRPARWRDTYGCVELPVLPEQAYHTLTTPLIGQPTDHHRVLYRTLRFGMTAFKPDLIHAEEEPDSLAALQIAIAHRLFAPRHTSSCIPGKTEPAQGLARVESHRATRPGRRRALRHS